MRVTFLGLIPRGLTLPLALCDMLHGYTTSASLLHSLGRQVLQPPIPGELSLFLYSVFCLSNTKETCLCQPGWADTRTQAGISPEERGGTWF